MAIRNTILDLNSLNVALHRDLGRTQEMVQAAASDVSQNDVERAHLVAAFNNAMGKLREEDKGSGILSSSENALASRLQSYFVERALTEKPSAVVPVAGEVLEVKFDNLDLFGWLPTGLKALFKIKPHAWIPPAPVAVRLGDQVRIALFSDWGSGLYGAPKIRESIEKDAKGFQIAMHLGDTYYSGTTKEIQERLVDAFPRFGPAVLRRTLNGNHEMYSGGEGYFDKALAFVNQPSSCFAYQNSNWLLVALDTAYVDHNLDERDENGANKTNQVEWLKKVIADAGAKRKVILFSHHQPFSQLDHQGPRIVAAMGDDLLKRIHVWYWGHEHRCVIYATHNRFGFRGRCIGHGGFPAFRDRFSSSGNNTYRWVSLPENDDAPAAEVLDGPNKFIEGEENRYSPHGYVTLDLNGDECVESYFAADAEKLRDPQKL
jgi:hypothetical protein